MLERNAEQSVEVRIPAWFMVFIVCFIGLTLAFSLYQKPTYEATVKMLVSQRSAEDANLPQKIPLAVPDLTLTVARAVQTKPVAQAVVEQLNLPEQSAREVLANTSAEGDPGTMFINVSYKDSDPQRAQLIANTIGEVLSEKASEVSLGASAITITATVWAPAKLPKNP